MNEIDEMKARDAVMRDPEFSLRILWIRQAVLLVLLVAGVVMTCVLTIRTLSNNGYAGNILFPACWSVFVAILLKNGMTKIKEVKRGAIAQQKLGQVSSETAVSDELST